MIELLEWLYAHKEFSGIIAVFLVIFAWHAVPNSISFKFGEKHSHVHHYDIECAGKTTVDCSGQGEQEDRVIELVRKNG